LPASIFLSLAFSVSSALRRWTSLAIIAPKYPGNKLIIFSWQRPQLQLKPSAQIKPRSILSVSLDCRIHFNVRSLDHI
jgi:hypothetical protein